VKFKSFKVPCCDAKPFAKCNVCNKIVCKRCMRKEHMKMEHDQQICTVRNFVAGWDPVILPDERD
jgi:hypothetical protein